MKKTAVSALLLLASQAHAASLDTLGILQQFNLVVLGNSTSYSHVDGRTYIGGNLSGGDYAQHPADIQASGYAGLTVLGNASSLNVNSNGASIQGNLSSANINSGSATVDGNATWVNFNGGKSAVGGTATGVNFNGGTYADATEKATVLANAAAQATSTDFSSVLKATSQQLLGLSDTGGSVTINGGKVTFNAVAVNGVAVFNLASLDETIFSLYEFDFNLNGADSVIFNTDVKDATINANFLGGSAQTIAKSVIWNFWNAENLTFGSQFGGTVLATGATVTNYNNIEGTVIANTLRQYGEIHAQNYTGRIPGNQVSVSPVPLPAAPFLMLSGLGLFATAFRRRA